jgi:Uncharacterized alpha/beta hydrolase domain (DUF2235)
MKSIVLCADGTWNTPHADLPSKPDTNVRKFYCALVNGPQQLKYYDSAVGTLSLSNPRSDHPAIVKPEFSILEDVAAEIHTLAHSKLLGARQKPVSDLQRTAPHGTTQFTSGVSGIRGFGWRRGSAPLLGHCELPLTDCKVAFCCLMGGAFTATVHQELEEAQ